jgi:hypothetical protein
MVVVVAVVAVAAVSMECWIAMIAFTKTMNVVVGPVDQFQVHFSLMSVTCTGLCQLVAD